jgi:predicted nucleic acid-binding protein
MIAIDSSALMDWLGEGPRTLPAANAVREALDSGPLVLCDVVLAEVCTALKHGSEVLQHLEEAGLKYHPIAAKAALRAGEMQRRYRQRGGQRERTIPDFLVGAHALLQCNALITFDAGFFHDYFKGLKVIVPSA